MRISTFLSASALVVTTAAFTSSARADVTSFMAFGGGATAQLAHGASGADSAGAFTYSIGVASSPLSSFVVGVMYRGATYFNLGTDFGMAARVATGGFARGAWGLALDAGPVYRSWGGTPGYGQWPVEGVLTVGSPWGFQLAGGTQQWDLGGASTGSGYFVALELDLLRLTVTRQGPSERWWPNPNPAGGHEPRQAQGTSGLGLFSF